MRAALLVAAALLAAPSQAAAPGVAQAPRGLASANVEWLGTIPSADGVSATFVGDHMYLSTFHGLDVYDVSNPAEPTKVGALDLPMFQNEDVATNGEILLMSRDQSLGLARLYVIDIRDPANPSILSTLETTDRTEVLGAIGHTATCIDDCRWAWLAGWSRGIDLVDLRDPAKPRFASRRKLALPLTSCASSRRGSACFGTHDVQFDSQGLAWVAGAGGTVAYDVSDPRKPKRRFRTNKRGVSRMLTGGATDGSGYNDFLHHNSLRRGRTVFVTEEDFRPGCKHPGSFQAWRIGKDGLLRPLDKLEVERDPVRSKYCSAHYFDERDELVVQGWYEAGARFIDVSDPRQLRAAGYWIPRRGNVTNAYWVPSDPAGEIAYALDEQRGVDILRVDRSAPVSSKPPRQRRGSGLDSLPDVGATIRSGRNPRPRQTVRYELIVANAKLRKRSPAGEALVELGRGLEFASGGDRKVLRFARIDPGGAWQRKLSVRVKRRPPAVVEASVTLSRNDGDPANDFAVDRDFTRRPSRAEGAAASYRPLLCRLPR